eukprot:CAMPEP_0194116882 /NCGR_PEP_ID=MMETSP0150-20130528/28770_1 /TAXON_ID=122233 /ORGANISM="Chaetoceros debilis, Strain MM31A-1" /LENGTH=423 /DNA_ID=CAMNT_0038807707 /DNA_START=192 /DNA_END=1463 /DNA_ORIENTATION=-
MTALMQQMNDEDEALNNAQLDISRRSALLSAASSTAALLAISSGATQALADDGSNGGVIRRTPIKAAWKAVDGLNSLEEDKKVVSFDASAYKAMMDDPSRTPLFEKAIIQRLNSAPGGPESQIVLDLGTGPFALFAIVAAKAGAGKVYAIEANKGAARLARETIKKIGFEDIIEVIEGFSSDVTLPNNVKADFAVAEIIGSVASEEGAYATVLDAHNRLVKEPNLSSSWIPNRIQTYAAPASYTLHNMFQPPEFDWGKLDGEPVRFNCRDKGLQLLSDPVIVEDISFADITKYKMNGRDYIFTMDGNRIEENSLSFFEELRKNRMGKVEAERVAQATGGSFTGMAMWPRLILDAEEKIDVNSRAYPFGGHQKSHWQTVLPIMSDLPVPVKGGDEITVSVHFDAGSDIKAPPSYRISGNVLSRS